MCEGVFRVYCLNIVDKYSGKAYVRVYINDWSKKNRRIVNLRKAIQRSGIWNFKNKIEIHYEFSKTKMFDWRFLSATRLPFEMIGLRDFAWWRHLIVWKLFSFVTTFERVSTDGSKNLNISLLRIRFETTP